MCDGTYTYNAGDSTTEYTIHKTSAINLFY